MQRGHEIIANCTTGICVERTLTEQDVARLDTVLAADDSRRGDARAAERVADNLSTALTQLRTGADEIQADTLFQSLSAKERAFLRLLARTVIGLTRLELRQLDETD